MEKIFLLFFLVDALIATIFYKLLRGRAYLIPALVAVGTAAYQMFQAKKQKDLADKLKPVDSTPQAVKEAIVNARMGANATASPGYLRGLQRIRESTSNSIDYAKRLGNPNQTRQLITDADAREKMLLKDLEVNNEAYRRGQQDRLTNLLMREGGYQKDSQDAYNAAVSSLRGAASRNTYNAVSTLGENLIWGAPDSAFKKSPRGLERMKASIAYNPDEYARRDADKRFVDPYAYDPNEYARRDINRSYSF